MAKLDRWPVVSPLKRVRWQWVGVGYVLLFAAIGFLTGVVMLFIQWATQWVFGSEPVSYLAAAGVFIWMMFYIARYLRRSRV